MWNPYDFTGKKIVIAGGTSGIGSATAKLLADQGADIYLLGRNQEKLNDVLNDLYGKGHKSYVVDFNQTVRYKDIFDDIISDRRKIDGVVYCVGQVRLLPVNSMKRALMDETMTVNLYSFIELLSVFSKNKYHDGASVVGISSIASVYPQKGQGLYAASKSAMNAFVTSLSQELVKKGIRINTVMPGATDTRMYQNAIQDKSPEEQEKMEKRQILGISDPAEIANVIVFLLSDASKVITGREIYADGGFVNV